MESNELLLSITRCPDLASAKADSSHPCAEVVSVQAGSPDGKYLVPEPWTGHIETAPILFVGSNPGFHRIEHFPRKDWSDDKTADFFTRRFDRDAGYTVQKRNGGAQYGKICGRDGTPVVADHWVRFWSMVKNHAATILGRRPEPGTDYALTEMVHCKSNNERGVSGALGFCSRKWMPSIMEYSPAVIVVLLGQRAHDAAASLWKLDTSDNVQFNVPISGRGRAVVMLPHPNARRDRKIKHHVSLSERAMLRSLLPAA